MPKPFGQNKVFRQKKRKYTESSLVKLQTAKVNQKTRINYNVKTFKNISTIWQISRQLFGKKDVLPDLNPGPLAPQVNSLPPE